MENIMQSSKSASYGLAPLFGFFLLLAGLRVSIAQCNGYELAVGHTNDFHARFGEINKLGGNCTGKGKCYGGIARLITKAAELRKENPNFLLLSAGDEFQGTLWFYQYEYRASLYFMDKMGYDVMALGNHEFDLGLDKLIEFIKATKFPIISANIDASGEPRFEKLINRSVVLNVGGEQIGIIGFTTQETPYVTTGTESLEFGDEVAAIQWQVNKLKAKGISKIIALGHAGYMRDLEIAKGVDGLFLVVGGHTNTFLYSGSPPDNDIPAGPYPTVVKQSLSDGSTKDVLVVQDYAFGKYLGFLKICFTLDNKLTWSGNPILMDDNNVKNVSQSLLNKVKRWSRNVSELITEKIGDAVNDLDGRRKECRLKECVLGNVIADAYVQEALKISEKYWAGPPLALMNSGGIRDSISQGEISLGSVFNVLPFRNTIDAVELRGSDLLAVFENSASKHHNITQDGRFLQMSGIRVTYDLQKPPGSRVVDVEVWCQASQNCEQTSYVPLDQNIVYTVFMPSFLVGGGDGYDVIAKRMVSHTIVGGMDATILQDFIRQRTPLLGYLEGRIRFRKTSENVCMRTTTPSSSTGVFCATSVLLFLNALVFLLLF